MEYSILLLTQKTNYSFTKDITRERVRRAHFPARIVQQNLDARTDQAIRLVALLNSPGKIRVLHAGVGACSHHLNFHRLRVQR